jgi:predicted O-methyltransferase YrrM
MPNPTQPQWAAMDELLAKSLLPCDAVLDAALKACAAAGLPDIQVTPCQGRFLQLLAQIHGSREILEIGTLGGYSTIWLARALPAGGRLITLELDPHHAQVARTNIARAGLSDFVDLRVGPALQALQKIAQEGVAPFDFIFIDADKPSTPDYFLWALKLSRRGSLIVVDNVIRKGALLDPASTDPNVIGMRRFLELAAVQPGVTCTALQTVGSKGYDGFALVLVSGDLNM